MNKITSIEIAKVSNVEFVCPTCNKISQSKYHVTINNNQTSEMCLYCHNKLSAKLFSVEKSSGHYKRKPKPIFKWMYGDEDESKEVWNKHCT